MPRLFTYLDGRTMTARAEQETTITFMRDDETVSVYTSNMPHLRRLRNLASDRDYVNEIRGGDDWGEFEVSAESFKLFSAIRAKRVLTDEQREAAAKRFREARA
jgi:hypothetical protein